MTKYIKWLLNQKDRDDDIGKLVRKFLKGKNVESYSWLDLRDFLKRAGASNAEINTCERSWVEYTNQRSKNDNTDEDEIEEIAKMLVEKGYEYHKGQVVQGEEPYFFIKGKKLIQIIVTDWADEEVIESIKQLK